MAMSPQTKRNLILYGSTGAIVLLGFSALIWGGTKRGQVAWDTPMYHRDARAPKICMCYWMRTAFRVPCEDVPQGLLLKE